VDELEKRIATQEEDAASCPAGAVTESTGEERFSDAHGPEKEDILTALQEPEAEEIPDPVPVEGDRGIPVEVFERVGFLEPCPVEAGAEALVLATIDLVLKGEFEEVQGAERGWVACRPA